MSMLSKVNALYYYWRRNNWLLYPPRLFSSYEDVQIDHPIFLVGNQGDGLTLIARMLRRHEAIVSVTGNHHYWAGADEMQNVMRCRLPRSLRQGGRFICKDFYHETFTPPRSWSYGADDLIEHYRQTAADHDDEAAETLRKIIREAVYRFGEGERDKRFVDKSQIFSVKMSYIDALLKDTDPYFVLITRNPYATCYRAAIGKAGDMRRYAKMMTLDERMDVCVQHWSNVMRCVLEDKDQVSYFTWMRFEDILREPRASLLELCDFLNLSFVEAMIPKPEDSLPFGSKYPKRWYPLRPDVNQKYLDEIPEKYIKMVEKRCGAMAEQFGYTPPRRPGD